MVAGRMMARRSMGKACFFHIQDSATRLQVYAQSKSLAERYQIFGLGLGDIVYIEGHMFRTKVGELTLWASRLELNNGIHNTNIMV